MMASALKQRLADTAPAPSGASGAAAVAPLIELRKVALSYAGSDDTLAVENLDFCVAPGEFVAVVGPSGCGKSTLMKLATGLRLPTRGEIWSRGKRVTGPLEEVGMAFQNALMFPWRTALGNLMLPLEVASRHRKTFARERRQHEEDARRLLAAVGLEGAANKFPWQLSGGMQQRLSLCRSLIHRPSLLMLDEPFGALDAFTREELWDILQAIWLERAFTVILVTHDLREAVYLADRVVVMSSRPGRIVASYRIDQPRPRQLDDAMETAMIPLIRQLKDDIRVQRPVASGSQASVR
jgi:NitT/TauT family transport system ATP-binding protein